MPKCDSCGFAHAQSHSCINCGSTDPFRRHRIFKLIIMVVSVLTGIVFAVYFYRLHEEREAEILHYVSPAPSASEFPTGEPTPDPVGP